jgi:pilus assembly protein CpaB
MLVMLAVVLALVGTGAVYLYVHNADKRAVESTRSAKVLIAVKSVPAGTTWSDAVKGGYFQQQSVPIKSAPSLAIPELNASVPLDEVAAGTITSGEVIVRPMFAPKTSAIGILPIPAKKMAVSFSFSSAAEVAGFIQPQSEVAVFVTYHIPGAGASTQNAANGQATRVLLPRVLVLATPSSATGTLNQANGGGGLITLALTQAEAEQVILASQTNTLYLGLLSDTSVTNADSGVTYKGPFLPVTPAR